MIFLIFLAVMNEKDVGRHATPGTQQKGGDAGGRGYRCGISGFPNLHPLQRLEYLRTHGRDPCGGFEAHTPGGSA